MAYKEKQFEVRIAVLERRVAELLEKSGLNAEAMDRYRYEEALEHLANTGDPSLMNDYLIKKNENKKGDKDNEK